MAEKYDVIVIGSGMGGLTAASILARLKNKRVLVLEKHYVAGGQTHEFQRNQYSWDVGIHYIGAVAPGEQARLLLDLVTAKHVEWNRMPDVFDRLAFPDFTLDVHKDPRKFVANLIALFPNEEKAIHQYIRDLKSASNWYISNFLGKIPDPVARMPFALKSIGKGELARMTTQAYMDESFCNDRLKAALTAQWIDYGLVPERSSFGLHALVVWGYSAKSGAYFPEGGGRTLAQAAEKVIEMHGGRIQVDTEVTKILIKDGAAYGVKVCQSNGWQGEFLADTIISNVGAELTFRDLIPTQYCQAERAELAGFERGTSMSVLYLGLKENPEKMGFKGENYWISENYDINSSADSLAEVIKGHASYGFISFPSLKNKQAHAHTAEICIPANPEFFDAWIHRPPEYYQAKDNITAAILAMVERHFPGFGKMIDYAELSTPVTMERYTSRPKGEPYGIPGTPARFGLKALKPKTPIKNLFLSGSDVCSLGIVGALHGGAAAAASILGPFGFMRIMIAANIAARKPAPTFAKGNVAAHMLTGSVCRKTQKTATVVELKIKSAQPVSFRPGQHVDLLVSETDKRSYSVLSVTKNVLTLVIDTKPGGPGSRYVENLAEGDVVTFSKPKGNFLLNNSDAPVCFISTGTGMVPMVSMFAEYRSGAQTGSPATFIFGTGKREDNYMPDYLPRDQMDADVIYCLSREKSVGQGEFKGRITNLLERGEKSGINFEATDFYVCGNPNMVQDVQRLLRQKGAQHVYIEQY